MGNVISGQQGLSDLKGEDSTSWNNGTIFGKEIERIIIKNSPVLQKRACCMGLTDGQPNTGNGLEVPIANIGITDFGGYASKSNFDNKWGKTVKNNYVYKDANGKVIENKNPYENESVKTDLGDTMIPTSDTKGLMSQGMTMKNLTFSKENVPSCSLEPTTVRFNETSRTGPQEYKGYPGDKTKRQSETSDNRLVCDNFMEIYAKNSVMERQCITTCGDIKNLEQEELDELGFGKVCREKEDSVPILDLREHGCKQGDELVKNSTDNENYHPAFHYPVEATCNLSPYGELYNSSNHFGNVFNSDALLRDKVNTMDVSCIERENYGFQSGITKHGAYLKHPFLINQVNCVNSTSLNNVQITAGNSAKVKINQNSDCVNTSTNSNTATPAAPTGEMNTSDDTDTSSGGDSSGGGSSGGGGGGSSGGGSSGGGGGSSSGGSGGSSGGGGMKPPVLPPVNTKRKLGLPVDDEIAYGVAGVVVMLIMM
ncbi:MAG: hypothetical protein CL842_05490 [Crocinitomicaceae bacterium]|nr:hypothetical protein [Crocinitomicaceae bacterium]